MDAYTATPWKYVFDVMAKTRRYSIWGEGKPIAVTTEGQVSEQVTYANAAHIVHCVNVHDQLVETLIRARMRMMRYGESREEIAEIDATLALARSPRKEGTQ